MAKIVLKEKRAEIMARYHHPWVFSGGIQRGKGQGPRAGELVRVTNPKDQTLGWGFYNPKSAISLRMITFNDKQPDDGFWRHRLETALRMRRTLLGESRRNFRLLHGEHDNMPGFTADVYEDLIVVQVSCLGMDRIKGKLAQMMAEITGCKAVFERSEGPAREQDGMKPSRGFLVGEMDFPRTVEARGFKWNMDPIEGHKTGLYLDQLLQHDWVEARAENKTVFDICSYTGGFSLAALRGGAALVRSLDVSSRAVKGLKEHIALNNLEDGAHEVVNQDLFTYLRKDPDQQFDLVILDPPALAKSVKAAKNAARTYSKLQTDAAKWVKPGGVLLTFSCSGVITPAAFQQSVFLGLRAARRDPQVIHRCGPSPDHPVNLHFPEGEYLKGLGLYLR